jgi:hypothetical protein
MGNLIEKRGRSELNRPASSLSRPISPVREFRQLPFANAFHSERANLADLNPRAGRSAHILKFKRQRQSRTLRPAGERHGDHRARALVEDVLTEDEDRPQARLLAASYRIEIGPAYFAPQYSGHAARSADRPTSARAFSKADRVWRIRRPNGFVQVVRVFPRRLPVWLDCGLGKPAA